MYRHIYRFFETINNFFALLSGVLLFGVAILTCIDVTSRYLFNMPIPGTVELTVLTMPWIVCLVIAFALMRGAHVRVTLLFDRLPNRLRPGFDLFAHLVSLLFFCLLWYGAWGHFWSSWEVKEFMFASFMTLPWWLAKLGLPIGIFFIAIQHLLEATKIYRKE